jgi:hypothetical protein
MLLDVKKNREASLPTTVLLGVAFRIVVNNKMRVRNPIYTSYTPSTVPGADVSPSAMH